MDINTVKAIRRQGMRTSALFVLAFACFLPFTNSLYNLTAGAYIVYLLLCTFRGDLVKPSFSLALIAYAKYLILLFFVLAFSVSYSEDQGEGWKIVFGSITLILMPFFLSLAGLKQSEKHVILKGFVWSNVAVMIINLIRALFRSIHIVGGKITFDASVLGGQEFWYSIVQGGNYFFIKPFSTFLHPTYCAVYFLFSIVIVVSLIKESKCIHTRRQRSIYCAVCIFLLMGIFLCSSRIVMVAAGLSLCIYFVLLVSQKRSLWLALIGVVSVAILSLAVLNNPRIGGIENIIHTDNNQRIQSWIAGVNVIVRNPLLGVGAGDAENALFQQYRRLGFKENYDLQLNEHNQFLQIANRCGLIGLLCFTAALLYALRNGMRRKDFLQISFSVTIILVCLVECFIGRQAGITFFTFAYGLLFGPTFDHSE